MVAMTNSVGGLHIPVLLQFTFGKTQMFYDWLRQLQFCQHGRVLVRFRACFFELKQGEDHINGLPGSSKTYLRLWTIFSANNQVHIQGLTKRLFLAMSRSRLTFFLFVDRHMDWIFEVKWHYFVGPKYAWKVGAVGNRGCCRLFLKSCYFSVANDRSITSGEFGTLFKESSTIISWRNLACHSQKWSLD